MLARGRLRLLATFARLAFPANFRRGNRRYGPRRATQRLGRALREKRRKDRRRRRRREKT